VSFALLEQREDSRQLPTTLLATHVQTRDQLRILSNASDPRTFGTIADRNDKTHPLPVLFGFSRSVVHPG